MKVLAIDVGASSGRCMIVELKNNQLLKKETYRFLNAPIEKDGELFWDINNIFNEIKKGIKVSLNIDKNISSIGIDTWGCDYGLIDDNDQLISLPRAYRDKRNISASNELLNKHNFNEIYSETGIQFLPFNTVFQLYDDIKNKRNFNKFLMIPDLLNFLFTGNKWIELTNLSTTSLYNPTTKKLSKKVLKMIDLKEDKIPDLIYPSKLVGTLKKEIVDELGVYSLPFVSVGSHDTASAVAALKLDEESCFLSSGTWSLLGIELKEPMINEKSLKYNFTNEIGLEHTIRFLKNIMGLFIVQEIRKDFIKLYGDVSFQTLQDEAREFNDNDIYIDINNPSFNEPGDMLNKFYKYLKETNQFKGELKRGQIVRIIYESMAFKYKEELNKLSDLINKKIKKMYVIGGGSNAKLLNEIVADTLNIEVISYDNEATVSGNALSQFVYLNEFKDLNDARDKLIFDKLVFKPENIDYYQEKYKDYKRRFLK